MEARVEITSDEKVELKEKNADYLNVFREESDRHMWVILGLYFVFGLCISVKYETWIVGAGVGSLNFLAVYISKKLLPKRDLYQYVFSATAAIFMAQFIYQMHGMFEMHFFAFIGAALLISFRNWKLQIPLTLIVVAHHATFALLQFYKGYEGVYFTQLDYMNLETFIFHASLAAAMFGICGFWAYRFENETYHMLKLNSSLVEKDQMINILSTVENVAGSLSNTSNNSNSAVSALSNQISSNAASIEEVSAAVEEMLANIEQSYANANNAVSDSKEIESIVHKNDSLIRDSIAAIREISTKISIVEEIARQTNLLALNAAVEAANAGVAGKGFAVVAGEIRKLATRSTDAANDINMLSSKSREITEQLGTSFVEIIPGFQKIHRLIEEVSVAAEQQKISAEQISMAINNINDSSQQSMSEFEKIKVIADEMQSKSFELNYLLVNN